MESHLNPSEEALKAIFLQTIRSQMSNEERAAQAFSSLIALGADNAECIATAALEHLQAGAPIPPLFSPMDEAVFWADMATPGELDAYCLASFNRMAPQRQGAFLSFVDRGMAA